MVSVLQRPQGYILGDCFEATVNEAYAGYATVNYSGHGLVDGDYVYITSNVRSYNGFWYVNQEDTNKFKIRRYAIADDQDYVKDATVEFCKVDLVHNWSCVHLPIAYRLRSDLFPTNEADTIRTITSFNDDSGYVNININSSITSAPFPEPFEFLTVGDTVQQIIEVVSPTSFTINLRYDSTLDLVGKTVQRYYNNYNIQVRVYGGLQSSHEWAYKKPITLLATLSLVPDSNNEVFFSISEILKSQVKINNDLTLDTLPTNIDAFTQFYIQTAESYDDSFGSQYILTSYISSFTTDSFVGVAVNAKLNFKNIYSGNPSEYLMTNNAAKFLTLFSIPVLFGCYQDISAIYPNQNINILTSEPENEGWSETLTFGSPTGSTWNGNQTTLNTTHTTTSQILYRRFKPVTNVSYRFQYSVTGSGTYSAGGGNALSVAISFYDKDFNSITTTGSNLLSASGSSTSAQGTTDIKAIQDGAVYIGIRVSAATISSGSYTITLNNIVQLGIYALKIDKYLNGSLITTTSEEHEGDGVIRIPLEYDDAYDNFYVYMTGRTSDTGFFVKQQVKLDSDCSNQSICLTFLNTLGGFDYWNFIAEKEYQIDIEETGKTKTNIFPQWPDSFGEFADTIEKQTFRKSRNAMLVRSQYITEAQLDAIKFIKTSPLVQIINSRTDRRTVIVDGDSFTVKKDNQDLYEINFRISYTDEISSQKV